MRARRTMTVLSAVAGAMAATVLAAGPAVAGPGGGVSNAPGLEKVDTLRESAPKDLYIGVAVAGGGHHATMPYPDPFPNDEDYREVLARDFSSLTPENQLKWEFMHPAPNEYKFEAADAIVEFAEEHGQVVRGHTLLWHSQNPSWLEEGDNSPEELREILKDHIYTVVGRYGGKIHQWDVANEILDGNGQLRTQENIWIRELGPGIIADAFRWAHDADPNAQLFFNDYGVESINAKSDAYYELIQELLADGVPVDGFSVQAHLSLQYGLPGDLETNLQRFAELGLKTAITELDVRMPLPAGEPTAAQLEQQAEYYNRALQACLAVEGCESFTAWGATDKYSWVPVFFPTEGAATIMWENFTRKPAYCALEKTLVEANPGGQQRFAKHPAYQECRTSLG